MSKATTGRPYARTLTQCRPIRAPSSICRSNPRMTPRVSAVSYAATSVSLAKASEAIADCARCFLRPLTSWCTWRGRRSAAYCIGIAIRCRPTAWRIGCAKGANTGAVTTWRSFTPVAPRIACSARTGISARCRRGRMKLSARAAGLVNVHVGNRHLLGRGG